MSIRIVKGVLVLGMIGMASTAFAHVGVNEPSGWLHGLTHPLFGLDHLLAMVAVGLWSVYLSRQMMWVGPIGFVSMMSLGFVLGLVSPPWLGLESGIALSVLILGAMIAFRTQLSMGSALAIIGLSGLLHGFAHGVETEGLAVFYALGMILTTALLHASGVVLGRTIQENWARWIGGGVALSGGWFLYSSLVSF